MTTRQNDPGFSFRLTKENGQWFGNLLMVVAMTTAVAVSYFQLDTRIAICEARMDSTEEMFGELRADIATINRRLDSIMVLLFSHDRKKENGELLPPGLSGSTICGSCLGGGGSSRVTSRGFHLGDSPPDPFRFINHPTPDPGPVRRIPQIEALENHLKR